MDGRRPRGVALSRCAGAGVRRGGRRAARSISPAAGCGHHGAGQPVCSERIGVGRQHPLRIAGQHRVDERRGLDLVRIAAGRDDPAANAVVDGDLPVRLGPRCLSDRDPQAVGSELQDDVVRGEPAGVGERADRTRGEPQQRRGRVDQRDPIGNRRRPARCGRRNHLGLADELPRQVVQVRRLLDHLAAAGRLGTPPRGRRRVAQPARGHEVGRPVREQPANLRERLEAPQVVPDRRDETPCRHVGGDPGGPVRIGRGKRLLGQERDAPSDERLEGRDRRARRNGDKRQVRPLLVEHALEVLRSVCRDAGAASRDGSG